MSGSSSAGRASGTAIIKLAQDGNNDLLRQYLKDHPDEIHTIDFSGDNLVSVACWHGHFDTVTMLLDEFDLDVNHANMQGGTALHRCCSQNNSAIALLLIHKGADPYIKDNVSKIVATKTSEWM